MKKSKPAPPVAIEDEAVPDSILRRMRPAAKILPALLEKSRRGRPPAEAPKVLQTLRIDADVLAAYRATGPGWTSRMNAVLKRGAPRPKTRKKA